MTWRKTTTQTRTRTTGTNAKGMLGLLAVATTLAAVGLSTGFARGAPPTLPNVDDEGGGDHGTLPPPPGADEGRRGSPAR